VLGRSVAQPIAVAAIAAIAIHTAAFDLMREQ
jgi:hypothetical protein